MMKDIEFYKREVIKSYLIRSGFKKDGDIYVSGDVVVEVTRDILRVKSTEIPLGRISVRRFIDILCRRGKYGTTCIL